MYIRHETGKIGEDLATKYLENLGYTISERNFVAKQGEIDIIAKDKQELVFVEVKTRKDANFAEAKDYVTLSKQRRIITAANMWLANNRCEKKIRFDVIELYYRLDNGKPQLAMLNHIENAFYVSSDD